MSNQTHAPENQPSWPDERAAKEREIRELRGRVVALQRDLDFKTREASRYALEFEHARRAFDYKLFLWFRRQFTRCFPVGSWRFHAAKGFLNVLLTFQKSGIRAGLREGGRWTLDMMRSWPALFLRRRTPNSTTSSVRNDVVVPPHLEPVDVIICVHNALEDVRRCLTSVVRHTRMPVRLYIVDDGSGPETATYLKEFALHQRILLIRNEEALGYTRAANLGLKAARSKYIIMLNSDTEVTPGWIDRMIACADSDPRIGLVGPLSNTASWQSIPRIFNDTGDWAENLLPENMTATDFARMLGRYAGRVYPRVPFLNGFCLLIKRAVLKKLGPFDEKLFGEGYGEENDYALRATKAGWQLAVADDTYVYHYQSRSYSHERRKPLAERANRLLHDKHGARRIEEGVAVCMSSPILQGLRARAEVMLERQRLVEDGRSRWEGRRVLFLLPVIEPGGGAHVILQEARAMKQMGVDVRTLNYRSNEKAVAKNYPDAGVPMVFVDDPAHDIDFSSYDAVVATLYLSVFWMPQSSARPVKGYYIQDYEPLFYPAHSMECVMAKKSYRAIPDLIRFAKTEWNRRLIEEKEGVPVTAIGGSVDIDLFRPRSSARPDGVIRIGAMVRPNTPRRAPDLTMRVLGEVARKLGRRVQIMVFGCSPVDPEYLKLAQDLPVENVGVLERHHTADFLGQLDVFADFSTYQAMGLTAMEAMASGAAVIVPAEGGSDLFARHEENVLVVDTRSETACREALERLVQDHALRQRLQQRALFDACKFHPEQAAWNILHVLLDGPSEESTS
jgi:GT2 family glycosyltransferase